jgi:2-polyprenyl-6-hydroxyphenyl methylase/3-demethylubiquinone-9 3-methyltransferase
MQNSLKSCLELGSGSGYKLNKYILPVCKDVYGLDLPHATEYCEKLYPEINWINDDFDYINPTIDKKFDLIICFDVIEHLIYPESLLNKIKSYSHLGTRILLSTPERDLVRGSRHFGPTPNEKHVREWNTHELAMFLKSQGFHILNHHILEARKLSFRLKFATWRRGINTKTCQLFECMLPVPTP